MPREWCSADGKRGGIRSVSASRRGITLKPKNFERQSIHSRSQKTFSSVCAADVFAHSLFMVYTKERGNYLFCRQRRLRRTSHILIIAQYTMEKIHRTLYKIHFKLHTLQSLQQVCGEVQHLFESHTSQFSSVTARFSLFYVIFVFTIQPVL